MKDFLTILGNYMIIWAIIVGLAIITLLLIIFDERREEKKSTKKEEVPVSNAEHALENAVYAIEHDIPFEVWKLDINLEYIAATPDEVWSMAQWVLFNKCQYCDFRPMEKDEEDDDD